MRRLLRTTIPPLVLFILVMAGWEWAVSWRAAHASGNAHQFTSEEARAAGSKRHANNASRNAAASGIPPKSDTSLS